MVRGKKRDRKMYKAKDRNKCMASDNTGTEQGQEKYKVRGTTRPGT
jgi:hypothetical protein